MSDQKPKRKNNERPSRSNFRFNSPFTLIYTITIFLALPLWVTLLEILHPLQLQSYTDSVLYPYVRWRLLINLLVWVAMILGWLLLTRSYPRREDLISVVFVVLVALMSWATLRSILATNIEHVSSVRVENRVYHLVQAKPAIGEIGVQFDVYECEDGIGIYCHRMIVHRDDTYSFGGTWYGMQSTPYTRQNHDPVHATFRHDAYHVYANDVLRGQGK